MITKTQIIKQLKKLGLSKGDNLIIHSALSSIGKVKDGADTVIDAILEVIGCEGNLMVPAFGSGGGIFNPTTSNTKLGIIPATVIKRKQALRSRHPLASVAVIGPKAKWLIDGHENVTVAHGRNSPYMKLCEMGGKILLLGVDQDRNTFLHTVEELAESACLRNRKDPYIDAKGKTQTCTSKLFPGPHRDFIGIQSWLEENNLTTINKIGSSIAQLMPMQPLLDSILERMKSEPALFISDNPNLPDGIWQKAAIREKQTSQEAFTLCFDSQYAGQYIEEIIDNMKRFGIDKIVLSYINNTPWQAIDETRRKWYLKGLKNAGIKIAAVRFPYFNTKSLTAIENINTDTVILPSTTKQDDMKIIIKKGYKVMLENVSAGGNDIAETIKGIGAKRLALAYNPSNFAMVGENPFLSTYKTQARKYIQALFINDALADGTKTQLEQGLSEIKELISILRCKSFEGLFILQEKDATKFFNILKEQGQCPG